MVAFYPFFCCVCLGLVRFFDGEMLLAVTSSLSAVCVEQNFELCSCCKLPFVNCFPSHSESKQQKFLLVLC